MNGYAISKRLKESEKLRGIPVILSCSVMQNSQGNIQGIVFIAQDISELKRTEKTLKVAKKEAGSVSRTKTQFLANMSHEIRTPLNSIVGFSQILLKHLEAYGLPRKFTQYLETIKMVGNNLSELINNILDLSKIEAGKTSISFEPINLRLMVQGIYFINKTSALEKGVHFNYNFDQHVPGIIDSDRTKLNQILMNLVTNAIKFTPKDKEVRLMTSRDNNMIKFEVIDNGIGIPEERLSMIFDQFEQADGSITRDFAGTGLGLAITIY